MVQRAKFDKMEGGFVGAEVRQVQPSEDIEVDDVFDDDLMEEVEEMPVVEPTSLLKAPEDMPEMPEEFERPKKSNAGRKPRKPREAVHTSLEMVDKKKALHEAKVLEITYKSLDKSLLMDLLTKQYLTALEIHEDSAPTILNYVWKQARVVDGKRMYTGTLQATAQALDLSYASVQKVLKKMISKKLVAKEIDGFLIFNSLLTSFFESLTVNRQVVLTFEELEEEQMESITSDSKINEEMAN